MPEADTLTDGESHKSKSPIAGGFDRLVDNSFVAIDRIDYQNTLLAFFSEYLDLILDDWMELRTALICENFQSDKVPDDDADLDALDALDDARVAAIDKVIEEIREGLYECRSAFRTADANAREARLIALRGTMRDLREKVHDLKKLESMQLRRFSRTVYRAGSK
jgi:hypothetical protein